MKNVIQESSEVPVHILKISQTQSLSGKSTLTYHVGCDDKGDIMLRVWANTGGGYFSRLWLPLRNVRECSEAIPADHTITGYQLLHKIFSNTSANNVSFYFAVLLAEGFVRPAAGIEKRYERIPPDRFMAEVQELIQSGVNLPDPKIDSKPKPSKSDSPALNENSDASPEVPIKKVSGKSKKTPIVAP